MNLEQGIQRRDEALDTLKAKNAEYIQKARSSAFQLLKNKQAKGDAEVVCADDIWEICPPPPEINPKVMGAVLSSKYFSPAGFTRTKRPQAHARPITLWTWK